MSQRRLSGAANNYQRKLETARLDFEKERTTRRRVLDRGLEDLHAHMQSELAQAKCSVNECVIPPYVRTTEAAYANIARAAAQLDENLLEHEPTQPNTALRLRRDAAAVTQEIRRLSAALGYTESAAAAGGADAALTTTMDESHVLRSHVLSNEQVLLECVIEVQRLHDKIAATERRVDSAFANVVQEETALLDAHDPTLTLQEVVFGTSLWRTRFDTLNAVVIGDLDAAATLDETARALATTKRTHLQETMRLVRELFLASSSSTSYSQTSSRRLRLVRAQLATVKREVMDLTATLRRGVENKRLSLNY
eukprot:PhM_4_TR9294/c0_g1_i1/m.84782